jgi:hypothetical protein
MPPSQTLSIERVVVLLTPVFAAAATWLATLVANNVPGAPQLGASQIMGIEIAVFVSVVGVVIKWLHGRQKPEVVALPATLVVPPVVAPPVAAPVIAPPAGILPTL